MKEDSTFYELVMAATERVARLMELRLATSVPYQLDIFSIVDYLKANRN